MSDKKQVNLSWDDFKSLGNPDNAPDDINNSTGEKSQIPKSTKIRIILDRKNRRGKSVSLVLGLESFDDDILKPISKKLKTLCGGGGNLKHGEIMIQGDHRDKIIKYFNDEGYTNVKKSGG